MNTEQNRDHRQQQLNDPMMESSSACSSDLPKEFDRKLNLDHNIQRKDSKSQASQFCQNFQMIEQGESDKKSDLKSNHKSDKQLPIVSFNILEDMKIEMKSEIISEINLELKQLQSQATKKIHKNKQKQKQEQKPYHFQINNIIRIIPYQHKDYEESESISNLQDDSESSQKSQNFSVEEEFEQHSDNYLFDKIMIVRVLIIIYTIMKNKVLDTMEMVMILIMTIIVDIDFIPIINVDILYKIIYIIIQHYYFFTKCVFILQIVYLVQFVSDSSVAIHNSIIISLVRYLITQKRKLIIYGSMIIPIWCSYTFFHMIKHQ